VTSETARRRRAVALAGHLGDAATARAHLDDPEPAIRSLALGATERSGALTADDLRAAQRDPSSLVRRRAAELAASRADVSLLEMLRDVDARVVETAAWACGERVPPEPGAVAALSVVASESDDAMAREAAVAALGAIGDPAGLPAVLRGCSDRPNVRRRAVLALAPFDGPEVLAALERARTDRDWQVRQAAEDLLEIVNGERP
jgi:HEAT repeat protein